MLCEIASDNTEGQDAEQFLWIVTGHQTPSLFGQKLPFENPYCYCMALDIFQGSGNRMKRYHYTMSANDGTKVLVRMPGKALQSVVKRFLAVVRQSGAQSCVRRPIYDGWASLSGHAQRGSHLDGLAAAAPESVK